MTLRPVLIALAAGAALWVSACSPKAPAEDDAASADTDSAAAPAVPDGDPTTAADAQAAQDAAMAASPTANDVPVSDATLPAQTSASAHGSH